MSTSFSAETTLVLDEALALFKTGHYFECHELLETQLWLTEADVAQKQFYQSIIHLAVAQHHRHKDNPRGYQQQQLKALQKTPQLSPEQQQWFQRFITNQRQS